ncbi:hypothetical protein [Kushneria sp. TE3]|uniref:hypothetical protein n=1 Tax=Kushneria sp. TE3 TaxID=3449832 RepID=UPI003F68403F
MNKASVRGTKEKYLSIKKESTQDASFIVEGNSALDNVNKKIRLYSMLDQGLMSSDQEIDKERLVSMLRQEKGQGRIETIWVVGHFSNRNVRDGVIDCLSHYKVDWIENESCINSGFFDENGLFIPDQKMVMSLAAYASNLVDKVMIWPWYCALPANAEQSLLLDLDRASDAGYYETMLRDGCENPESFGEAGLVWSQKTLPVFFKNQIDSVEKYQSWLKNQNNSSRAGWALNVTTSDASRLYQTQNKHGEPPAMHFGICLRARACTHNWVLTCQNLERTLYNLSRQRSHDFRVWLAVHEKPEINTFGLDVEFVVVDFKPPINSDGTFGNDKRRKRNAIGDALNKYVTSGFYYMQLDADDLIDISLVQCVRDDNNRKGYLIEKGYVFDYANNIAARCNEFSAPFWHQCGSCAVLYFEPEDLVRGNSEESYFEQQRFHDSFFEISQKHGRLMTRWADEMALYLVNHGENHWSSYRHEGRAGRASSKSNFAHRHQIKTPPEEHGLFLRYPELVECQYQNNAVAGE